MTGPIHYVCDAPQLQEAGGALMLILKSGETVHQFALPRHAMRKFVERARLELNALEAMERLNQPVPIKRGKRP